MEQPVQVKEVHWHWRQSGYNQLESAETTGTWNLRRWQRRRPGDPMFSIHDRAYIPGDGISRREWLRVGGLGARGLSLPALLRAGQQPAPAPMSPPLGRNLQGATFGRAKNVIFLWLQGGPPQHETFDPKPDAPAEIRGLFRPIATNVPGIRFCELLPRTARRADKLAVIRSLHTNDDNHDVSSYWVLTGYPYGPRSARQIKPTDWPYFGSIGK